MAQQNAFDKNSLENAKLLQPEGILDQLNLPPALIDFLRKHQKPLWIVTIVVVIAVVAISLYSSYRTYTIDKAASALDTAMAATSGKKDLLAQVAEKYTSTPSAIWARVELAQLAQKSGDTKTAVAEFELLRQAVGNKAVITPLVLTSLGTLYEEENNHDAALAVFSELAMINGFAAEANRAMGRINESRGNSEQAVVMYTKYLEIVNEPGNAGQNDPARPLVEARLNSLNKE